MVVDPDDAGVADPSTFLLDGLQVLGSGARLVWAAGLSAPATVLQRYQPSHPPAENCIFGMDFSFLVPFGVGIASGALSIFTNAANPAAADGDWTKGAVTVTGRAIYAQLAGGVAGTDYQLRWTANDTQGNVWPRTALMLCAQTS